MYISNSEAKIFGTTFDSLWALRGAGMYAYESTVAFTRSMIKQANAWGGEGGCMYLYTTSARLNGSGLINCYASGDHGGGVYAITDSTFDATLLEAHGNSPDTLYASASEYVCDSLAVAPYHDTCTVVNSSSLDDDNPCYVNCQGGASLCKVRSGRSGRSERRELDTHACYRLPSSQQPRDS